MTAIEKQQAQASLPLHTSLYTATGVNTTTHTHTHKRHLTPPHNRASMHSFLLMYFLFLNAVNHRKVSGVGDNGC